MDIVEPPGEGGVVPVIDETRGSGEDWNVWLTVLDEFYCESKKNNFEQMPTADQKQVSMKCS